MSMSRGDRRDGGHPASPRAEVGAALDRVRLCRQRPLRAGPGRRCAGELAAQPGERILDLGCGDGRLTAEIAATGADVLGVDLSDDLLAVAAARGLRVQRADGHQLTFDREFDAVFSNAALHWMRAPELVAAGVARALKPGGRFVGEMGVTAMSRPSPPRCVP